MADSSRKRRSIVRLRKTMVTATHAHTLPLTCPVKTHTHCLQAVTLFLSLSLVGVKGRLLAHFLSLQAIQTHTSQDNLCT